MREIKFRAWDNVDYMSTPFTLQEVQYGRIQFTSDTKIMQYTGMKDKNGKEIYEGDIMKLPLYGIVIVVWNEDVSSFQYAYNAIGKGSSIGGRMTNNLYGFESTKKYEIIGNIYQHPELLNQ